MWVLQHLTDKGCLGDLSIRIQTANWNGNLKECLIKVREVAWGWWEQGSFSIGRSAGEEAVTRTCRQKRYLRDANSPHWLGGIFSFSSSCNSSSGHPGRVFIVYLLDTEGFRTRHCKYTILIYWLCWAEGTWKTVNPGRGFLWPPLSCLKTILPEELMDACHRRRDWKSTPHSDFVTNCHTLNYSSKGPCISPKNNFLSSKRLTSLLFFPD